jgi:hypothetical protein
MAFPSPRWTAALGLLACLAAPGSTRVTAQQPPEPAIEPKAMEILKASCKVLAGAKAMAFDALSTYEKYARNGQPLFFSTLNRVTMERPNKLRVITPGDGTPDEFYYDGKTMMAYVPSEDLVAIAQAPPTIDRMVDAAWAKSGTYFPFVDVILADPCAGIEGHKLTSAFFIGQSKLVGGTTTDMVAVAGPAIQAQFWIGAEDRLPRMVKVVYPQEPARVLYETEFSNWRLLERAEAGSFASEKAAKGKPIEFRPPAAREPPPKRP